LIFFGLTFKKRVFFKFFSSLVSYAGGVMTMTFSLHESIEPNSTTDHMEIWTNNSSGKVMRTDDNYHLIGDKLRVPVCEGTVERSRIMNLVKRSQAQYPATLISGRAGTGKTAIAAAFAAQSSKVCWYSVESTDVEWGLFARYFSASVLGDNFSDAYRESAGREPMTVTQNEIACFLVQNFSDAAVFPVSEPALMVLDDIHHIFDAPWFNGFFDLLLYSLPAEAHLLLLCRSRPPAPLMRLRSKQMLNLIDEKVIAFNGIETEALFDSMGVPASLAEYANRECFGRVSKLIEIANDISASLPPS
jgi:ATP/maltotriose-dependent transcriptional regulator MalT